MKLLLYSHFFAPSVGGTETIVLSIARGLAELRTSSGLSEFEITLVTKTPAENFMIACFRFRLYANLASLNCAGWSGQTM